MKNTHAAAIGAAAAVAAATLTATDASATVRSGVGLTAPTSLSNYTVGCRYEARVKVDDAATPVRLIEGPAGSRYRITVAKTIPAADTAIFVWTPTQPGRRTLTAVQSTRGKRVVYSKPITVNVSRGIVAGPFCFSI